MWGKWGASLITVGALISVYGFLSAHMLNAPRLSFALGEHGDFPAFFSRIHPRFRTPHISIVIFAGMVWSLAIFGNFKWNVIISAVARLFVYTLVCAALPVLRRTRPAASAFRAPGGDLVAGIGIVLMLILVSRMRAGEWAIVLATMGIAFANWLWVRKRAARS
jgi:amino acid transporter